jgi:hypothetical protein
MRWGVVLLLVSTSARLSAAADVELLRTPNGGLQPQGVVDQQGTVHLVYFKARGGDAAEQGGNAVGDLFYITRPNGSSTWSAPVRVNNLVGSARRNNNINHAQLALGRNGRVHVVWFTMEPTRYWYTRLHDAGSAFEPQRNLVRTYREGVEAGASVAADGNGGVFVVWHAGDFSRQEQRAVYLRESRDDGSTFGEERRVNPIETGVCACCGLSAATSDDGTLYISYRAAGRNIHRDMTLLTSTDGGQRVSQRTIHRWELNACPVSTTTLATPMAREPLVAWETEGQVYVAKVTAVSHPITAPGSPPTRRKNPVPAMNAAGELLLVWADGAGWHLGGQLRWQVFHANGQAMPQRGQPDAPIPPGSIPEALALPDGKFLIIY